MNHKKKIPINVLFLKSKPLCFSNLVSKVSALAFIVYINNLEIPTIQKPPPRHKLNSVNGNKKLNYSQEKDGITLSAPLPGEE